MTMRSLAPDVTLDRLKRDAKALLKALKAGDPASAFRVSPYFSDTATIGLQDAQLVIAREYGFSSWTKLKLHVERGDAATEASPTARTLRPIPSASARRRNCWPPIPRLRRRACTARRPAETRRRCGTS